MEHTSLLLTLNTDARLQVLLEGFDGTVEFRLGNNDLRFRIRDGVLALAEDAADADVVITYPSALWEAATQRHLTPGAESLAGAHSLGATAVGEWRTGLAPYWGAWSRIVRLAAEAVSGRDEVRAAADPFIDSDDPVGRYVRFAVNGENHRVYYETAGHGDTPVLFLHTAGGDGRQYRNVLANPRLQEKFTMIAVDLPYHGKSLPPVGTDWWNRRLTITKDVLMDWVTGFIGAARIDRPVFVGCSVGGQLASDLCAHHPDAIRGAIGLNGLYDMRPFAEFPNTRYFDHAAPPNAISHIMYDATGPDAPEEFRHELAWIYASNQRDTYPADNEYYMFGHDLAEDGHLIDTTRTPLTILTGEYDLSVFVPDHGGQAVADKIPGATFRIMKGLSHFAPSDDPVRFGQEIEAALDDIVTQTIRAEAPA